MPNLNLPPLFGAAENERRTPASQWYDQSKGDLNFAVRTIIANELTKDSPHVRVDRFVDKDNLNHVSFTVDLPAMDSTPMSVMFQTYDSYTNGQSDQATIDSFKRDILEGKTIIPTEMRIYTDEEIKVGDHAGKHTYDTHVMYWQNPHVDGSPQEELRISDDSGKKLEQMTLVEKKSRVETDSRSEIMFNQSLRRYLATKFNFQE